MSGRWGPDGDEPIPTEVIRTVVGGLGTVRRAKALALEDGRAWEDLSVDAMDRYIELARNERSAPTGRPDSDG